VADETQTYGPNDWLVDEMYERFKADPNSVSRNWQDFFSDNFRPETSPRESFRESAQGSDAPAPGTQGDAPAIRSAEKAGADNVPVVSKSDDKPAAKAKPKVAIPENAELKPLKGVGARIVDNMEASLEVPTATSVRTIPAKLLEVNRQIINNHLRRSRMGKISFTHIIGFAIVEALRDVPAMANSFVDVDGKPHVAKPEHIGLGLAVDIEKSDGSRSLLVPCIKRADTLDFKAYWSAYDEIIRKIRTNKIGVEDFAGVTVTLTNPGTIGTVHSVPRLMPGQGLIVGVGSIDYPAEYQAADRRSLANIGVSKVVTVTSTYDHRIIQGAESGLFLKRVHELLTGADGFYDEIFAALGVPYEPARWHADTNPLDEIEGRIEKQSKVWNLINMYRVRGHLIADLDPLKINPPNTHAELDPVTYGLSIWDNDREFFTGGLAGKRSDTLGSILGVLRDAYCRQVGVEYMHIQNPDEKRWIQDHVEGVKTELDTDEQRHILERLNAAEAFEKFLHSKYVGQKRFGLEGAESAIPMLDTVLDEAARAGVGEAVIGMAHRGRLNVLINIVGKQYGKLFSEFEGNIDPEMPQGSGDVKYHKGYTGTYTGRSGQEIAVTLASNPSHLEAVDPIVEGMARAKQDVLDWSREHQSGDASYPVLPLLLHGDAAFAGQGVVAETLNLSALQGYRTGGTVHLVINNQVGFTTNPRSARSTVYATDVAKMVQAPILHVNGDDPEACVRVAKLAFGYRQRFHKDVVIDMVCYRRFGHNEGDEPSYTQPQMYEIIDARRSVRKIYTEALISRGDLTLEEAEQAMNDFSERLQSALDETRSSAPPAVTTLPPSRPSQPAEPDVETGVSDEWLEQIANATFTIDDGFTVHPKLAKQLNARRELFNAGEVDWALGEALAFGSLLLEDHDVRLSGQDTRRGTFSHRHSVLIDYETGAEHCPLGSLVAGAEERQGRKLGRFFIYDSSLSEYAALGFEYGYSLVQKGALTAWEAQFGDFINGAQIVIDQFLAASKDKWGQTSNLTLLLPHGYEGQGPEHSSARLERFLELAANDNMRVINATTAAQYFHALRRQVHSSRTIPLIVMSPKYLLRARQSRSPLSEFTSGSFQPVLDDTGKIDELDVERIIFCSGKIAFEAMAKRDELEANVAVVRLEQMYPWPTERLAAVVARYPNAREAVWLQEEPENMGPGPFVSTRLPVLLGEKLPLRHVARKASGSPATGTQAMHTLEGHDLLRRAFD
jgi:multifunctional 2-oxoglutarate metabolism enzyme